ncbi:Fur family transcriptional regulator [Pluralibacter gergoviae]|uniref:Fur family transcriptional regulator n=1 Tax=Enterobacterales TaxID=91347 RepID=UPI0009BF4ACA|nr:MULTISPECIES: transcriptional repressor [Enterobacterales]EKT9638800.1 transcriptional repressor [Pluralibacter gergoviae]EMD1656735.1 transcriptional repressor [Pluralibacter gergoviae]SUB70669.1 Ferric uptake regulation protein [Pluralibacter gergoviae]
MACNDKPKFIDRITSFGNKSTSTSKQLGRTNLVVPDSRGNDSQSTHIQRLKASNLRATFARISILNTLSQAAPHCLGAGQLYRLLNSKLSGSLTQATIYRVLNDLWVAGLLVRTDGVRGRATYALKPYKKSHNQDSLRCKCGEKLIFIEDPKLHEHLLSLAGQEGFELDGEPVFTVTIICAGCS